MSILGLFPDENAVLILALKIEKRCSMSGLTSLVVIKIPYYLVWIDRGGSS